MNLEDDKLSQTFFTKKNYKFVLIQILGVFVTSLNFGIQRQVNAINDFNRYTHYVPKVRETIFQ